MNNLWQRLNYLVPNPQCSTWGDDYTKITWFDERPLPTEAALLAVDLDLINLKAQKKKEVKTIYDTNKAFWQVIDGEKSVIIMKLSLQSILNTGILCDSDNIEIDFIDAGGAVLPSFITLAKAKSCLMAGAATANNNRKIKDYLKLYIDSFISLEELQPLDITAPFTWAGAEYQLTGSYEIMNIGG